MKKELTMTEKKKEQPKKKETIMGKIEMPVDKVYKAAKKNETEIL